ncbi:Hint domain-containing protein [Advenella sp. FME57]|uniref:Hint domain-containing protein n=1 Tax=Advenella sp. FME57 TaxID=2742604 RepID=UPI001865A839|nr:Hint domain-containing protein [Advenella sp. FME57]
MANITLGGLFQPTEKTVDQSSYPGDEAVRVQSNSFNTELTINNSTNSDDILDFEQHSLSPIGSTFTLNVGQDANVRINLLENFSALQTTNYNLDEGATLYYSPPLIQGAALNNTNFDLGDSGTSTLVYEPKGIQIDLSSSPTVSGLSAGDQIKVIGATDGQVVGNNIVFKDANGNTIASYDASGEDLSKITFENGVMVYACYLKGTHIATPEGEVKVETLKAGDKVLTASGNVGTVKWLGFRKLNRNRLPDSHALRASPVHIMKGAFADNVPHRDLTVSPGHRFNFDGALVPALSLVNGKTIVQDFDIKKFEYFHVELEEFDMLLAEGAAAESYLDVGDYRNSFENAETVAAHPDFGPAPERVVLPGYVQKITPEIIESVRRELFKRAQALTGATRTSKANLRIEVDGVAIALLTPCAKLGVYRFELPAGLQSDIRVLSNSSVVRDTSLRSRRDTRVIGVGLTDISLTVDGVRHSIDINDESLTGLNAAQDVYGTNMRWTTGKAVIPASLVPTSKDSLILELNVLRTHMYWNETKETRVRLRAA